LSLYVLFLFYHASFVHGYFVLSLLNVFFIVDSLLFFID
jgi:hypothetical protein